MRRLTLLLFMLTTLAPWTSARAVDEGLNVEVLDVRVESNQVTIAFDVKNNLGGETPDLKPQDVKIIENDKTDPLISIDDSTLEPLRTDESHPTITITTSQGKPLELSASSATIGIVYDAIVDQNKDFDTAVAGWQVIRRFLCASNDCGEIRTKVPSDLEGIGLFTPPLDQGGPIEQPRIFKEFPRDKEARADLLNFLTNHLKIRRSPPTSLFETLLTAVKTTADKAVERGGPAIVLVVSNSSDHDISDAAKAIEVAKLARERQVGVVTFRIAKEDTIDKEFLSLFSATQGNGGMFNTIRVDPSTDQNFDQYMADTFDQAVSFTPIKVYTVHYTTTLLPDEQINRLRVQVNRAEGSVTSAPRQFVLLGYPYELKGLGEALGSYLLLAIPVAILTAVLIVVLTAATRWSRSGSTGISR